MIIFPPGALRIGRRAKTSSHSEKRNLSGPGATRLLISLVKPFHLEGKDARVGASIGIALCPAHHKNASQVLKLADAAMYVAKRNKPAYAVYATEGVTVAKGIAA